MVSIYYYLLNEKILTHARNPHYSLVSIDVAPHEINSVENDGSILDTLDKKSEIRITK